jgi:hypothetical protein
MLDSEDNQPARVRTTTEVALFSVGTLALLSIGIDKPSRLPAQLRRAFNPTPPTTRDF